MEALVAPPFPHHVLQKKICFRFFQLKFISFLFRAIVNGKFYNQHHSPTTFSLISKGASIALTVDLS
jgi:hypothetical protein